MYSLVRTHSRIISRCSRSHRSGTVCTRLIRTAGSEGARESHARRARRRMCLWDRRHGGSACASISGRQCDAYGTRRWRGNLVAVRHGIQQAGLRGQLLADCAHVETGRLPTAPIRSCPACWLTRLRSLLASVGIPRTLQELGLPADKQQWAAESAITIARLVKNNPRPLDLQAMQAITAAAYTGDRAALRSA